jgi:tetratricopeptide (TPR) repeat protein
VAALCQQYLAQIARHYHDAQGALINAQRAESRLRASGRRLPGFEASLAGDLAYAYYLNGRVDDADREYAAAIQMHRAIGRGESPTAVAILNNWGLACIGAGDLRRGLELIEEVLRIITRRSAHGTPPPYAVNNHASVLFMLGRYDEALDEAERAWHVADQAGAGIFKLSARVTKASVYRERGDLDEAERILAEVATSATEWPEDSFAVLIYRQGLASLALARGRFDQAREAVEPIIQLFEGRGMRIGALANALRLRAEIRWRQGDRDAATQDARRALSIADTLRGSRPHTTLTGRSWLLLARIDRDAGDLAAADTALENAVEHLSHALGEDHLDTKLARRLAASPPTDGKAA